MDEFINIGLLFSIKASFSVWWLYGVVGLVLLWALLKIIKKKV